MNNRWLGTQRELKLAPPRPREPQAPSRMEEAFWRSWLATGARRAPIDRRRARGGEARLKEILVGEPSGAVDFSSAMARQAVDAALHELPPQHKQVVKLAYFGGLTNREIAQELGLSVNEVRRALRASLASVSAHFERVRVRGRRAIRDLAMVPWWRGLANSAHCVGWPPIDHVLQTGIVAVMAAAAAALVVAHQASAHVGHPHRPPHAAAIGSAGTPASQTHSATLVKAVGKQIGTQPLADVASRAASLPAVPVKVTVSVRLPVLVATHSVLSKPRVHGIPQLPFGA